MYNIHFVQSISCYSIEEDISLSQSTALVEACRNRDVPMVELLLKFDARDDDCKALSVTVQNKDETLTAKLLSIKVSHSQWMVLILKHLC